MRKQTVPVQATGLSRWRRHMVTAPRLVIVSLLIVVLTSCTTIPNATNVPAPATSSPAQAEILTGDVQPTTFEQITSAIDKLYADHPDVNSFLVKGVTYTPATRDKVMKICHEGGLVSTEAERESQEVLACAPLIFFFYYYGQQTGVAESTDIARLLYWNTVTEHSAESKEVLTKLLQGWGIK